jgi:molybdopterin synthase catalytic subunit
MIRAGIVTGKIEIDKLTREAASPESGALAIFLGTVRSQNEGREVTGIEYSAYEQMAEREMKNILNEATTRFSIHSAIVEHRVGELEVGDASIGIVVTHAHRGAALDALRYIIDETKLRAPIWKLEHYVDGSREWVGAGSGKPQ